MGTLRTNPLQVFRKQNPKTRHVLRIIILTTILSIIANSVQTNLPIATASRVILSKEFDLVSNQKGLFQLDLVKGQKLRFVTSSTDSSSGSAYLEYVRPDGTRGSNFEVKSSGAGTNAYSFGPVSQTGLYSFEFKTYSSSQIGRFGLKVLLADSPKTLQVGNTIELDFSEKGSMESFIIDVKAQVDYRLVTFSQTRNSSIWSTVTRPDGTEFNYFSLRGSQAGYEAVNFTPSQSGLYVFDSYSTTASDTNNIKITLLEINSPSNLSLGNRVDLSFSKIGTANKFSTHLTKGYVYRFVTNSRDSNSSSLEGSYVRPDGTEVNYYSLRSSGAGASAIEFGPASITGEYVFRVYKSRAIDTSDVSLTVIRIDKPVLVTPNTPTQLNFAYAGQAFAIAIPVNKGDKIQLQTEATQSDLGIEGNFTRPDGTRGYNTNIRFASAGKQVDQTNPTPYSQSGFYVFELWLANPLNQGKVTLTVLGSTSSDSSYKSELPEPVGDRQSATGNTSTKPTPTPSTSVSANAEFAKIDSQVEDAEDAVADANQALFKLLSGSFSASDLKAAIEAAALAVDAASKASKSAKEAKDSAKSAESSKKAALKERELAADQAEAAALSARQAANAAKSAGATVANVKKAAENEEIKKATVDKQKNSDSAPEKSKCERIAAQVSGFTNVAVPIAVGVTVVSGGLASPLAASIGVIGGLVSAGANVVENYTCPALAKAKG